MLKQRIITALILAPLVLACILYLPAFPFSILMALLMLMAAWEWADLSGLNPSGKKVYVLLLGTAFFASYQLTFDVQISVLVFAATFWCLIFWWVISFPESQSYWCSTMRRALMGAVIIVAAWLSAVLLKQEPSGAKKIILLLFIVWGADIGAYFSGRAWGNSKLAPKVSPGKTWAGAYGGIGASVVALLLFAYLFGLIADDSFSQWLQLAFFGLVIAIISIFGDLAESMVKRYRGVKDSGQLLPGHGGIMDRIDSLVATLPAYTLLFIYLGRI